MMNSIDRYSKQYAKQGLSISIGLFLLSLLVMRLTDNMALLIPATVSVLFSIVFDLCDAALWRKIAKKDASLLPNFYTGVSGFRMLLALFVMLAYYLVNGREAMLTFFLVFMTFYMVLLIHHTVFFMRVSNNSCNIIKADKTK